MGVRGCGVRATSFSSQPHFPHFSFEQNIKISKYQNARLSAFFFNVPFSVNLKPFPKIRPHGDKICQ